MAELEPFRAWRFVENVAESDLSGLICPPYDVIPVHERSRLAASSKHNAVHIEVPDPESADPYANAASIIAEWKNTGVLVQDPDESFYVYRMGFKDEQNQPRQTVGVFGELRIDDATQVLPHEQTTPKDSTDRLNLLRATGMNISPVWTLCRAPGFSDACQTGSHVLARATSPDGVHHQLWQITQRGVIDNIREAVAKEPLIVADGHHRTHVQAQYADEIHASPGSPATRILSFVSELSDEQLFVKGYHRIIEGVDWADLLKRAEAAGSLTQIAGRDAAAICLADKAALVLSDGQAFFAWVPSSDVDSQLDAPIDPLRLNQLLAGSTPTIKYQHDIDSALEATGSGAVVALLRPVSVDQIDRTALTGWRMPPKSTFFYPKLATGMLFRSLD